MRQTSPPLLPAGRVLAQLAALVLSLGCYRAPSQALPPAPIPLRWPELTFDPARQCHGEFHQADLAPVSVTGSTRDVAANHIWRGPGPITPLYPERGR